MACLYKKKLWENNWCPMTCQYCTFEQESHCKHNKATNADRIRAMSDEEFAKFLADIQYDSDEPSKEEMLEWLKQPAEGE